MSHADYSCEVLVVGSGSAGATAAIAASRTGADTLLAERSGFLGGISTAVLDTFYAFYTPGEHPRKVVSGIPDEVVAEMTARGAAFERPNTYGAGTGITYDPEVLKRVWDTMVTLAGARLLLHALAVAVRRNGRRIEVDVATRGGMRTIRAQTVIDATGDADICALAGAPYEAPDHRVQSLSTSFRVGNVDTARAEQVGKKRLWELMREAAESGTFDLPRLEGSAHRTPQPGVMMALMTRVRQVDATDPDQLTVAELEGRRQAWEYFRFLRQRVPGYENATLISTSPAIGVRESRRVTGEYVLTVDDCMTARQWPDQVARCGAPLEDHHGGRDTRWAYIPGGACYGIPYRCLLPRGVPGLLVAGRCFSATHDAHASARSMGTCMAMGQAAGTAAALAARHGTSPADIPVDDLLARLNADGADFGQHADSAQPAAGQPAQQDGIHP